MVEPTASSQASTSAPAGAGQPEAGSGTAGKPAAAPASPGIDPEALSKTISKQIQDGFANLWRGIESATDKKIEARLRREREPRSRRTTEEEDDLGLGDPEERTTPRDRRATDREDRRPSRDHARDTRDAIRDFRQENENWRELLPQVMEIANDPQRARPFRVVGDDGEVDYLSSLNAIRDNLELQAYREQKAKAATDRKEDRERQKRDAAISGSGASGGEEDVSNLTDDELLARMEKEGLISETDPLRKR
jgi:hypothetical protein